jgi:adenine deaminase
MNIRQRQGLTAVARGHAVADLYVRGGPLLDVYTGELYPANVAIKGERVAYVGLRDDMVGPATRVIDASERVRCPGYIDPHVRPAHLITPSAMARHIVPLGTTTAIRITSPSSRCSSWPPTSCPTSGSHHEACGT